MLVTQLQYDRLRLQSLELEKKKEAVEESLGEAGGSGEWHDNPAWEHAQHEYALIAGRLKELKDILNNATIVDQTNDDVTSVAIGHLITICIDGDEEQYTLLGPLEANPTEGIISYLSPLGQALMALSKGDKFTFSTPDGDLSGVVLDIQAPTSIDRR